MEGDFWLWGPLSKGICMLAAGYLGKRDKEVAGLTYICSYCLGRKRLVVCKYNSYLAKGLERIIACRIAWTALYNKVLSL